MKQGLTFSVAAVVTTISLLIVPPAFAHRMDEYLQAATVSLAKDSIHAELHLTPGMAVFPTVIKGIDTNNDGVVSPVEQSAYAGRVLRDLTLTLDNKRLTPRLVSYRFASVKEMKSGVGESEIVFDADVPRKMQSGGNEHHSRRLIFENCHQSRIAAYLVNCLVPSDPNVQVTAQDRNYLQSWYRLDYVYSSPSSGGNGSRQMILPPPYSAVSTAAKDADHWAWVAVVTASTFALLALIAPPNWFQTLLLRFSGKAGNTIRALSKRSV